MNYLNETTLFLTMQNVLPFFFFLPHAIPLHTDRDATLSHSFYAFYLGWRRLSSQPSVFWSSSGSCGSSNIHLTIPQPLFPNPLLLLSVNYNKHSQADEHRTHSVNFMMIYFSADGTIKAEEVHISQSMIFATLSQLSAALIRTLSLSGA